MRFRIHDQDEEVDEFRILAEFVNQLLHIIFCFSIVCVETRSIPNFNVWFRLILSGFNFPSVPLVAAGSSFAVKSNFGFEWAV